MLQLPNILASELFPTSSRSLGVSLSTASQWSFNALIAATFPALRLRFGARNVLNGFALVSLFVCQLDESPSASFPSTASRAVWTPWHPSKG